MCDYTYIYIYIVFRVQCAEGVSFGPVLPLPAGFGILVSTPLRSSGPRTHAGLSFLLRKLVGFDRFDDVSASIRAPPLLMVEAQPAKLRAAGV